MFVQLSQRKEILEVNYSSLWSALIHEEDTDTDTDTKQSEYQ